MSPVYNCVSYITRRVDKVIIITIIIMMMMMMKQTVIEMRILHDNEICECY